jgi:futalosine hydrolase
MTQEGPLPVSEIGIPILVQNGSEFYDHLPPNWGGNLGAIIKETPPGIYRQERGHPLARAYLWGTADRFDLLRPGPRKGTTSQPKPPSHYLMKGGETDQDLFRLFHGPTLTVSMASGDLGVANERFQRYGAYAENMEGSAVVQACFRFQVPVVECRGVSNIAGVRSKETWQLQKSIAHCHGIVLNWLETLNSFKLLK